MKRPFFPTEIESRRELARIGLISKHHYHPQIMQFDVLDDPRWQANIEAKQDRFQLDRYRPFAFQHGSMAYNPRHHEWIPNDTDDPWANCPGKNPEHEYHILHTQGWSLPLTNITLCFDVKSESIYYWKICIKCNLERGYCPPNHAIKAIVIWEPENHCRIFDVGRSYTRMIKYQKRNFLKHSPMMKQIEVTDTTHTCILVVFGNTFMMNPHFLVLRFSQNLYTNVMKIAHIMPHSTKTFLSNTMRALTLVPVKHQLNLKTYT